MKDRDCDDALPAAARDRSCRAHGARTSPITSGTRLPGSAEHGGRPRAANVHRKAAARRDRRRLADLELVARHQVESEPLEDRARDDRDLGLAEAHADAGARASAERHVRAARKLRLALLTEARGAKLLRLREDLG